MGTPRSGRRYGPERASVRALGGESAVQANWGKHDYQLSPRRSPLFVKSATPFSSSATHRGVGNEDNRAATPRSCRAVTQTTLKHRFVHGGAIIAPAHGIERCSLRWAIVGAIFTAQLHGEGYSKVANAPSVVAAGTPRFAAVWLREGPNRL